MSILLVQQVIPVTAIQDVRSVVGEGAVTTRVLDGIGERSRCKCGYLWR